MSLPSVLTDPDIIKQKTILDLISILLYFFFSITSSYAVVMRWMKPAIEENFMILGICSVGGVNQMEKAL